MIHANNPQRILALHPLVADDDILQRIVQRMADMQRSGDIGRRVYDGKRFAVIALGTKQPLAFPMLIPARFDGGRVEIFI